MTCISIPECTQRIDHLTTSGGHHGQESEEGEEGEERSEEDCEEDPQGLQEEEVSSPDPRCRRPCCRHVIGAIRGDPFIGPNSSEDERGCRRDIRSNGWIVLSGSSLLREPVRQRKQAFFVRCGSRLRAPQFHRNALVVRSGPDVFADALVPCRSGSSPVFHSRHRCLICDRRALSRKRCADGYPFAKAIR